MTYYFGYTIFHEEDGTFQVCVAGWCYDCQTIEEAKRHILEGK